MQQPPEIPSDSPENTLAGIESIIRFEIEGLAEVTVEDRNHNAVTETVIVVTAGTAWTRFSFSYVRSSNLEEVGTDIGKGEIEDSRGDGFSLKLHALSGDAPHSPPFEWLLYPRGAQLAGPSSATPFRYAEVRTILRDLLRPQPSASS